MDLNALKARIGRLDELCRGLMTEQHVVYRQLGDLLHHKELEEYLDGITRAIGGLGMACLVLRQKLIQLERDQKKDH